MKTVLSLLAAGLFSLGASPALAEFARISDKAEFVSVVSGKKLTRALVDLSVTPGGAITGKGAVWEVKGSWNWEGGYFCRSLNWGGDDLGYNCQEVARDGNRIRFTSDKGAGETAVFTLK
ncbi:dihydrodipicolinate reductase [Sulfitobacter delicatus]|uniref:Dihydrodipicolinate reductase n=1 Tax=Sulfitobacter delicatus TaxID=218672 RepID=A0A1G7W7L8_9RHOB|nr:dihydrodipicolinate reductase [Sulfitobacter delicatus]SDG67994.1 hypothetical protein SAMN04489759_11087 [Sulfitobacter delicatus]